jgi:hypothetical protein
MQPVGLSAMAWMPPQVAQLAASTTATLWARARRPGLVAEGGPEALILDPLVWNRAFDQQDERVELAARRLASSMLGGTTSPSAPSSR